MVPAQQSLAADGAAGARIDDRLIVEFHLAVFERELQIVLELHAPIVTLGDRERVADDLAAAGLLGLVQREIGVAEQFLQRRAVARRDGVTDAGAAQMLIDADREWMVERRENAFGGEARPVFVGADHDHNEFVAADPRDLVARIDDGFDPLADLLEHGIAGLMSERVVDVLEAIEIDQDQRDDLAGTGDAPELLLEQLDQGVAVPQIGERVTARDQFDPVEGGVAGNDVLEHRPADDDDAEKENADEDGEHGVHQIEARARARSGKEKP